MRRDINLELPGASPGTDSASSDQSSLVEQAGIEYLGNADRHSSAWNLFFVFFGSQMCFGVIVIGVLPITFGLGLWDSFTAITVGTAIGSIIFCPAVMLGVKSGTSSPAGSVAHFGVRGRLIGSSLTLLVALGFFALTVWTGGDALVSGVARLYDASASKTLQAIGAALICALTLTTAYFGHKAIVASEKVITYVVGAVLIIGVLIFIPGFNWHYAGGNYSLGGFWPSWFLSASVCAVLPVSYAGFEGDYSRHIPEGTSPAKLIAATGCGIFLGCWAALMFAAFVGVMFKDVNGPFVQGLVAISPKWFVFLIILSGILGSQPQGSLCIYHAGLASQVFGLKLSRPAATIVLGCVCLALVLAGIYWQSMVDMMLAFMTIMAVAVTPWLIINLVGHYMVSDHYDIHDLFAYLTPGHQGRYWYAGGWNWRASVAWVLAVAFGLLFTHTTWIEGPLSNVFGGVALDYAMAAIVGGVSYYIFEKISPTHVNGKLVTR